MQKEVKVTYIGSIRSGQTAKGRYCFTSVAVTWEEESFNGTFEQSVIADLSGMPSDRLLEAHRNGESVKAQLYFQTSLGKDGFEPKFNRITLRLPKEYTKEQ